MKLSDITKSDKTINTLIALGLGVLLSAVVFFLWNDYSLNTSSKINAEKAGQLGDFIGGLAGSLWALAGVFLFYKALTEQREDFKNSKAALDLQVDALHQQIEEFKLNRIELYSSRKVYEEQSRTLKVQQFDSNFFSLLNVYLGIKQNLDTHGNGFFKSLSQSLPHEFEDGLSADKKLSLTIESYLDLFNAHREHLSHYFRAFYRVVKVVDSAGHLEEIERYHYSKILRSQLSDYELVVLYYNSHSIYGEKTKPYILKYNLLKHIPTLFKPEFRCFPLCLGDSNFTLFLRELDIFLECHIEKFYQVENEIDRIEEKFTSINIVVGIYFNDFIELKFFCDDNISVNGINSTDDEFLDMLNCCIYDKIVSSMYVSYDEICIKPSKVEISGEKHFCISIETDTVVRVNKDKY